MLVRTNTISKPSLFLGKGISTLSVSVSLCLSVSVSLSLSVSVSLCLSVSLSFGKWLHVISTTSTFSFLFTSLSPFCELVLSRDESERRLSGGGPPPASPPTPTDPSADCLLLRRLLRLAVPGWLDWDLIQDKKLKDDEER